MIRSTITPIWTISITIHPLHVPVWGQFRLNGQVKVDTPSRGLDTRSGEASSLSHTGTSKVGPFTKTWGSKNWISGQLNTFLVPNELLMDPDVPDYHPIELRMTVSPPLSLK